MLSFLSIKSLLGIFISIIFFFMIYFVNDYINLRASLSVSKKTIDVLQHRRKVTDKLMLIVERRQNENFNRQTKALLEMDKKGYIYTDDGSNPKWMRYQP